MQFLQTATAVRYPVHMFALLLPVVLAGQPPCTPEWQAFLDRTSERAAVFDLQGAVRELETAAVGVCPSVEVARVYGRGLLDARAAFLEGGSPESLVPVRKAIAALEALGGQHPGSAEIARLALQAAAAAAQSERDEMRLYLDSAIQMESLQVAAGEPGAPLVSATELAGDLWLQVHRYDDARRAYVTAMDRFGLKMRLVAGVGRANARLGETSAACSAYLQLLKAWGSRQDRPVEIEEARDYIDRCQTPAP
jgi:hypothetical protein